MDKIRINSILSELKTIREAEEKLKLQKASLRTELMNLFGLIQLKGQRTFKYEKLKIKFKGATKRELNIPLLLKDYNFFDSRLRKCFPLVPKLDIKQYKEMMIINPNLITKYVTEKNTTYSIEIKEAEKETEIE